MTDLFETIASHPEEEAPETPESEAAKKENHVLTEVTAEQSSEEVIEVAANDVEGEEIPETNAAPEGMQTAEKRPEAPKQANVVEGDPYEFEMCLITVAMALMPGDGSPDGRMVVLGVRNHQDEPLLATCRLSDLMPLPDPVKQLLEQLKDQLPARSEKAAERKAKAEEAKKKLASKSKPAAKTPPPAKAKKAEKPTPTSMNLFDMFDQTSK